MAIKDALKRAYPTLADYQTLMDQGRGDEDISALYRVKRALLGAND